MKIIDVKDVSKSYGKVQALKKVNLTVEKGHIYGFIGPNGAGKTTLIRILLGLLKVDEGSVTIFERDVWHEAVHLHRDIAYVPGDVNVWPNITGGEAIDILINLRQGTNGDKKRELIKHFDFDPKKKCRAYSKGNRQKIALIAALASDAELFILDEPTSGLDPLMEKIFQDYILALKKLGKTVFLSSHILSEVEKLCDHIIIIKEGEIIESGKLDDLRHLTRNRVLIQSNDSIDIVKNLNGIHDYTFENNIHAFQIEANALNALIKHIAAYDIVKFVINPPTLEDLFMRHYKTVEG